MLVSELANPLKNQSKAEADEKDIWILSICFGKQTLTVLKKENQ